MLNSSLRIRYEDHRAVIDGSFFDLGKHGPVVRLARRLLQKRFSNNRPGLIEAGRHRLEAMHPDIYAAQIAARSEGGLAGDYQWLRLCEIEKLIQVFQPRRVIEFGSGTSSIMFAKLLGSAERFRTYEESPYWLGRMLHQAGAHASAMDTCCAERRVENINGESVVCYDVQHGEDCDMIYVDGPRDFPLDGEVSLTVRDPGGHVPCADVAMFWAAGIYPKVIVIDGKRVTLRYLMQQDTERRYEVYGKTDLLLSAGIAWPISFQFHSIMIRRD